MHTVAGCIIKSVIFTTVYVSVIIIFRSEMYRPLQLTCFSFVIWYSCYAQLLPPDIQFYEYGEHVEGEQISYMYNGVLPGFTPIYTLNVTSNREELKPGICYLRVEYCNILSDVNITYDPVSSKLNFHVKFPFVDTVIGVLGYSVPMEQNPTKIF